MRFHFCGNPRRIVTFHSLRDNFLLRLLNSFLHAFLVLFRCLRTERRTRYIMKTVQHYVCETCGTVYADKAKAKECEKGHKAPERIVGTRYLALGNDRTGYPLTACSQTSEKK